MDEDYQFPTSDEGYVYLCSYCFEKNAVYGNSNCCPHYFSLHKRKRMIPLNSTQKQLEFERLLPERRKDAAKIFLQWELQQFKHPKDFKRLIISNCAFINCKFLSNSFFKDCTILAISNANLLSIPVQIFTLPNLRILDLSYNRISTISREVDRLVNLQYLNLSFNYITSIPNSIGRLFNLRLVDFSSNPIDGTHEPDGDMLFSNEEDLRQFVELKTQNYLKEHLLDRPPAREWRVISPPVDCSKALPTKVKILTYNILCPRFATLTQYPYCPDFALKSEYRRQLIKEEVFLYNADIMCFQEMSNLDLKYFYQHTFEERNYSCVFHSKTVTSYKGPHSGEVDGCCVFYKQDDFEEVCQSPFHFASILIQHQQGDKEKTQFSSAMFERYLNRDNVALTVILRRRSTGRYIAVSTAHLFWDPQFADVKLIQTIFWVAHLRRTLLDFYSSLPECQNFSEEELITKVRGTPMVLCGDMNSLPDSEPVEFIQGGKISLDHELLQHDNEPYGIDQIDMLAGMVDADNRCLHHDLTLTSAYDLNGGIPMTNMTNNFRGVIDYIFYSPNRFHLLRVLDPVNDEWFQRENCFGCPNEYVPSDHISLLSEFQFL